MVANYCNPVIHHDVDDQVVYPCTFIAQRNNDANPIKMWV